MKRLSEQGQQWIDARKGFAGARHHDGERCLLSAGDAARNRRINELDALLPQDARGRLGGSNTYGGGLDHGPGAAAFCANDLSGHGFGDTPVGERQNHSIGASRHLAVAGRNACARRRAIGVGHIGDDERVPGVGQMAHHAVTNAAEADPADCFTHARIPLVGAATIL